jgi:tetratricopeptide (TPR) repeat protein
MAAALHNNLGSTFYTMERYEDALVEYQHALAAAPAPGDASVWFNMGKAFQGIGRHEEAIAPLERSLEIDPTRSKVYAAFAFSLAATGRLEEAVAALERAIGYGRPTRDPGLRTYIGALREFESRLRAQAESADP